MTKTATIASLVSLLALGAAVPALAQEVNIYTTREPGLIQPILDAFTAETGVAVNTVFLENGLIERVQAERESSPADILMTVDFGALIERSGARGFVPKGDLSGDRLRALTG